MPENTFAPMIEATASAAMRSTSLVRVRGTRHFPAAVTHSSREHDCARDGSSGAFGYPAVSAARSPYLVHEADAADRSVWLGVGSPASPNSSSPPRIGGAPRSALDSVQTWHSVQTSRGESWVSDTGTVLVPGVRPGNTWLRVEVGHLDTAREYPDLTSARAGS